MKYSLRSLMTFSIRDVALLTVIVGLTLAWLMDHRVLIQWGNALEREKNRKAWESEVLAQELRGEDTRVDISDEWITIRYMRGEFQRVASEHKIPYKPRP